MRISLSILAILTWYISTAVSLVEARQSSLDLEEGVAEYFDLVGSTYFPENLIIGEITYIDVAENGDILVVDGPGQEAWLFDKEGRLKKTLTPEECHPGFDVKPQEAHFLGEYGIFLKNNSPPGFLFGREGQCIGTMPDEFRPPRLVATDTNGSLFALYDYSSSGSNDWIVREYSFSGNLIKEFSVIQDMEFPNISRRFLGGGFAVDGVKVYQLHLTSPKIYQYDKLSGNQLDVIEPELKALKPLTRDLPKSVTDADFMSALRENRGATKFIGLLRLSDDRFLIGYTDIDGYKYAVLNSEGEILIESFSSTGHYFFASNGDMLYRVKQPALKRDGTLPNPFIEQLSLKESVNE